MFQATVLAISKITKNIKGKTDKGKASSSVFTVLPFIFCNIA
jgi:hypothetical protein